VAGVFGRGVEFGVEEAGVSVEDSVDGAVVPAGAGVLVGFDVDEEGVPVEDGVDGAVVPAGAGVLVGFGVDEEGVPVEDGVDGAVVRADCPVEIVPVGSGVDGAGILRASISCLRPSRFKSSTTSCGGNGARVVTSASAD